MVILKGLRLFSEAEVLDVSEPRYVKPKHEEEHGHEKKFTNSTVRRIEAII